MEKAGTITSDSLAGESISSGGDFGSGHEAASSQPSSSTTTNTTDISGATTLRAAPDAEARQAVEGWSETAQLNAGRGLRSEGINKDAANLTGSSGNAPHGKNIQEGGFDSGAPNASFNAEIGGKNDPGRVALNEAQRKQAESGPDAGAGPRQGGVSNDGQFDVLKDTSA